MASTFSTNLALELIGTGDQAGTWGITTNTNLGTLIEQAISGYVTQAVATGTDTTITIPDGATGVARNMYIELTGTGGASTNLIVPANKKLYFIFNNSTGAVTVKVSGQTGVSVPQGKKVVLTSNGTDIVNGLNYIADFGSNSATITQLTSTSATITNLTLTSLVLSNLSIASANVTTLTSASATITNLLATSLTVSGNTFLATSSGNVGIGTSSPQGILHASSTTTPQVIVQNQGGGSNARRFALAMNTDDTFKIVSLNDNATVRTDNIIVGNVLNGNVGIGTSSPAQKLEVNGNIFVNVGAGNPYLELKTAGAGNNPYVKLTADTNYWELLSAFSQANDDFLVRYNGTALLDLDKNGNLGLGVTPSAWLTAGNLDLSGGNIFSSSGTTLGSNAYYDVAWKYKNNGAASYYAQVAGAYHAWFTAPSGTAGNTITFTQAMTLDASGNLGVGTTSPSYKLDVVGSSAAFQARFGTSTTNFGIFVNDAGDFVSCGSITNDQLRFFTNGVDRATITAGGEFYIAGTTDQGAYNLQVNGTGVWGAGAYVNGSDERIKEDITPLVSGLDVVEKLNPVTYRYKESWSKDQSTQTGFIAQELLTALDGEVYVDGVVQQGGAEGYYSVAYQNIIPILTKAIQELSAKNDALEARLAALEAK